MARASDGLRGRARELEAGAVIRGDTRIPARNSSAHMLHYWSNRADGPFVAVNCKAAAGGVLGSELFGHEKGL
jgi:DNA-binding NtrC family response regulator